ncbi:MAG: EAL domain-containing protein [Vallitalea sp.]|jgi:EAL domain-containing protein (putative c-di-GMP-specific phosphodiesterase class I)|nr:EAL domain-containing protein [Vallitalea sp.]
MNNIGIKRIIENESIDILMQVILSPHEDFAVGIEAFARGIDPNNNKLVNPNELFEQAKEEELTVELDKLCVKKALQEFTQIYIKNKSTILFINITDSFISYSIKYDYLIECADKYGIPYQNIAIDLSNFDLYSVEEVEMFIDKYRAKGFYMSIDDIGQDYFNLDKLLLVNPDIIKINNFLLNKLPSKQYKNYLLKFISIIAHEMGMVVVAKGIENEKDLESSVQVGAQFVQGFFISKPSKLSYEEIDGIINSFKNKEKVKKYFCRKESNSNRSVITKLINFIDKIKGKIDGFCLGCEDETFKKIFNEYSFIENCWILDMNGIQISDSYINKENFLTRNSSIFNISKKNMDYSKKDIYDRLVNTILDVWVTKPFHSLLTNNICLGVSKYIVDSKGKTFILCLNVNRDMFSRDAGNI